MHGINSPSFSPSSLTVSAATWRLSHELTLPSDSFLSSLAAEQIQSCLKVKRLKIPKLPPVSLSVWWQEWTKKIEKNKTHSTGGNWSLCKCRLIFLATCASAHHGEMFWCAQADSYIQNIQQYRMEGKVMTVLSSLLLQIYLWSGWHVDLHFENQTWNNLPAV